MEDWRLTGRALAPSTQIQTMKQLLLLLLGLGSLSLAACQDTGQVNEVSDASTVTLSISGMT